MSNQYSRGGARDDIGPIEYRSVLGESCGNGLRLQVFTSHIIYSNSLYIEEHYEPPKTLPVYFVEKKNTINYSRLKPLI